MLIGRGVECDALDGLVDAVRRGESRALVLRGESGVGKTALLEYLVEQATGCRVVRAAGVESEMELAFAGLHQLLAPLLDRLEHLPAPQRDALRTAFGLDPRSAPDRFFIALAVLSLLSDVAEERPLLGVADDVHWLDRASAQALAFAARRLGAESVGLVFAVRGASDELAGLPELVVQGLSESDAHALLDSALTAPLDPRIRNRIVSEARGNPLALLDPRSVLPAGLAGGFGLSRAVPLEGRIEESFRRRLDALPPDTRRLARLAAADPVGEPALLWRAAERLAIATEAATPAVEAGLVAFCASGVRFCHPLARSAAYGSASVAERHSLHRALAEAIDPELDPDRRAWHLAEATPVPDEAVAGELERSAGRAQSRGGFAAAGAFLERAAMLTPEPARRAERLLAAARATRAAGALDEALRLLVAVEAGPHDPLRAAEVERLRGQIALDRGGDRDAASLLLSAARRLDPLNADLARETHLDALIAAIWAGGSDDGGVLEAAQAARAAPPGREPPRAADVLLDALALRLTEGYTAAAPALTTALELFRDMKACAVDAVRRLDLAGLLKAGTIALELWDADSWHAIVTRQVQFARDTGALVQRQLGVNFLAISHFLGGERDAAVALIEEDRLIADASGNPPYGFAEIMLAAWRGRDAQASELIDATLWRPAAGPAARWVTCARYARAMLYNGLGRHAAARDCAWQGFIQDAVGYGPFFLSELVEAAARTGRTSLVDAALEWLSERTRVTPTEWALGIEARARALLTEGDAADSLYRESIEHLSHTRVRVELARAHLLYGEWLRRERRRTDAREQLRTAYDMLDRMGPEAFADRARRELLATGETARRRTVETRDELTAQEAQVARLAREGLSNPAIGARLFISPGTVKYHLRKIFIKLDIHSRGELDRALPRDLPALPSH